MLLLFAVFTHSFVLHHHHHHHRHRVLMLFRGAFKFFDNLSLRFSLYRIFTFSHLRFPHFLFVISYWQFSFSAVVVAVAVVVLNFPSYRAVRCLHPYVCSHCVCVCLCNSFGLLFTYFYMCFFMVAALFNDRVNTWCFGFFYWNFRELQNFSFGFSDFFSRSFIIAPNLNRVVRWNRTDDNEQQH